MIVQTSWHLLISTLRTCPDRREPEPTWVGADRRDEGCLERLWDDKHRSLASRELYSPQQRSFLPEHPVSPLETNPEANAAWPDGRMGEAQCDHLGDALMPILYQLRAYKPDGLLVRVQGDALALMSQFSSDKDSFRAAAECMSELSCDNKESYAAAGCLSFTKPNPHGVQYRMLPHARL